jgi:DNA invertase Pin-like site-specific DNA recombinase
MNDKNRTIRAALYARVSTDQGEQDPEQQLIALRHEAERRGYVIAWEGSDMVTGDSELWEREEGKKLWAQTKSGNVDVILVWDSSRLSRQHPVNVFKMLGLLERMNVGVACVTEPYLDTTSSNEFRDLIVFIITWFNNYFLKKLREATVRGKAAAKARGIPQGTHPKNCGIDYPCPTGAHESGTGRSLRPPRQKRKRGVTQAPTMN